MKKEYCKPSVRIANVQLETFMQTESGEAKINSKSFDNDFPIE